MMKLFYQKTARTFAGLFIFPLLAGSLSVAQAAELAGTLELGGATSSRLISNVNVTLYEATEAAPIKRGSAKTNGSGQFLIETDVDATDSIFFVTADLRPRVRFVTVLGPELPAETTINELTTVASSYSMAQFYRSGQISGDPFALTIAAMMNDNIVTPATGESSPVLLNSPNADQTNSLRMTRSLASLLHRCAINPYIAASLIRSTKEYGKPSPANTAVALANLARDPGKNVSHLYRLSKFRPAFTPALEKMPDAWTVTVKVNHSGNDDTMQFGGPANVAFDAWGYAWIPNNVPQGSPNSGDYLIVLQPNGQPADGTNGSPVSPITGGGIYGGGWGVAIDAQDQVWVANFGWGGPDYYPSQTPDSPIGNGTGSVSLVKAEDGEVLSNPDGFFGGVWRAQAIEIDADGNVWVSSFENDSVVVFKDGDPDNAVSLKQYNGSRPFGLSINPDGSAWVADSGGLDGQFTSSLAKVKLNAFGELEQTILLPIGDTLKVVVSDSQGNAWLASQGNDTVYCISPEGVVLGAFSGGGINGPWGLAIDGEDNVWISNFGPLESGSNFTDGGISKICGANPDSWPRRKTLGDPLSPDTGFTVPSAGDQVLLANNEPLYGPDGPPSFSPLMRQTSLQIDAAGNIWTVNNWKPDFDIDNAGDNPGGDGIVIFVGLAPPPPVLF
ncbi:hypothetical protein [Cerasicoccus arenae]|uniref:Virginiamycin B lyase n=1 Tax=Cerasicoccus arenae TaxID=424488 RepID=A0A8J3DF39_9BACT|nr:hypothetical protein [Cerasicoccus arenae]MBK1859735.1 hypothetical protein [Cerasicoccus arenae]GHB93498.1 hypothetical protein GCM10007047_06210 [Cerasicoccus arenae]